MTPDQYLIDQGRDYAGGCRQDQAAFANMEHRARDGVSVTVRAGISGLRISRYVKRDSPSVRSGASGTEVVRLTDQHDWVRARNGHIWFIKCTMAVISGSAYCTRCKQASVLP